MRIAIDARLRAYRAGGIAEHISRLLLGLDSLVAAGSLDRKAIRVLEHQKAKTRAGSSVITGDSPGPSFPTLYLNTPPHHRLEGMALPVELQLALGFGLNTRKRVDLLHSPDMVLPWAWRGASVVTIHDLAFMRRPELLTDESRRYYSGVTRSLKQAQHIIAVSEYTRDEILALTDTPAEKITVVHNPVHPRYRETGDAQADAAVLARHQLGRNDRHFLLFVSTIEPRKNIVPLLEAFRALLDQGRELDLALAGGDGWLNEDIYRRHAELGLQEHARFLGFVSDQDLAALYRQAAMLVHPALDEGFGLTPAEAMAAGTPVVVSDAGSLPEVVGDAGLRVPAQDVGVWVEAIGRVLDDPLLAEKMREEGLQQTAALTPDTMARETMEVYRAAWGERAGSD